MPGPIQSPVLSLGLYGVATAVLRPIMPVWLAARARRGKEDSRRRAERYGRASVPRPDGPVIWCHAASIGEMQSVLPLLDRLTRNALHVVLTTGTVSSARQFAANHPQRVIHQYAPLDHDAFVARFLDHWRPSLALRVESEIWPAAVIGLQARGIPLVVVNGRLSPAAVRGWRRVPALARRLFGSFALVLAQTSDEARAFTALGAPAVEAIGNLKAARAPLPAEPAKLAAIAADFGARPRWLAASIHPGEDAAVADAHLLIRLAVPNVLTVVVPRHPDKADAMTSLFHTRGLEVARRSRGECPTVATDIYLADTFGELGLFFRTCPVVFIGKTLAVGGGQNPIEPAQLGCALAWGADMSNFPAEQRAIEGAGGARRVNSPSALAEHITALLQSPESARSMGAAAQAAIGADLGALDRAEAALAPYIARALSRPASPPID